MVKLTPKITEQFNSLLLSDPSELREHLTTVYFGYVAGISTDIMPYNFKEVSESVRFLISFLEDLENNPIN